MTPEPSADTDTPQGGVLASLPRTRPGRTSARREAARAQVQSETVSAPPESNPSARRAKPAAASTAKSKARAKPAAAAKAKPTAKPKSTAAKKPAKRASTKVKHPAKQEERAPKQGYEPEEELELGNTVHPPSGGELLESIADIFGELAGAGAGVGGRLLKDALSIFRRP